MYRVEKIVRKGEIACYKQFLLFSLCFPQLYIFSASKSGIMWQWVKHSFVTYSNSFPNKPWFLRVCSTSYLKTLWENEKLLVMSNFSFSHSVFYPFEELSTIFIKLKIVVCRLFEFGRV